jgi:hypothetical protein
MPSFAKLHDKTHDKNLDTKPIHSSVPDNSVSAPSQKSAIQKVAKVCAMHGLPSGSTGDLGAFMRALDTDKLLAMNFWSLVVKITDQINDQISVQNSVQIIAQQNGSNLTLLEAIAQGVTGRSVAEIEAAGGEPKWLIQQMAAMLAGEDIQIPAAAPVPAAPASAEILSRSPAPEAPALILTPPPAEVPMAAEAQLQPFLVRSRLVLEPEATTSQPLPGQRALFGSETQEEKARPSRVPLEGYGASIATGSVKKIALTLLLLVALGGGAFFVQADSTALQQKFGPSLRARYNAAWHGAKGMGSWVSSEVSGR